VLSEASRETRTLRLRIELPNPGQRLKAGLYAQVSLAGPQREALVVPAEAVIRTGRRSLVYLAQEGGRYRPVEVEVGEQVDDRVVVLGGLSEGQQVVASGQFLIDSEASLQGVLARAASPVAGSAAAAGVPASGPPAAATHRTRGKVVAIGADAITLDHAAVPALKWPAMTMPFKLSDKALAKGLQTGQAVEFDFVERGDDHVLTRIAPLPAGSPGAQR
jgi:Cu(I)/Ag(I) efflux system membrane fusion protein